MFKSRGYTLKALSSNLYIRTNRFVVSRARSVARNTRYGGRKYLCPVCGYQSRKLVSLRAIAGGVLVRPVLVENEVIGPENYEFLNIDNYACPACGAPDKARLIAWFMKIEGFKRLGQSGLPLLHFEPETGTVPFFSYGGIDYLPSSWPEQIFPSSFDITDLSELEGKLGGFICSHILEHVHYDALAADQLFRSLAPGGFGIVLVPVIPSLGKNWEIEGELSEDDRWRFFGQGDHLRIYSKSGLRNLLEGAGFAVRELNLKDFGEEIFEKFALTLSSTLYVVEKE